ncbi:MAG TPA: phage capsid protein [Aliidongia sp.]|nr:phage capsid protein [Aliidongia sp.]
MSLISAVSGAVIPASNGSSFPITPELTSVAIQYRNPAQTLIADDVMPMTPPMGTKKFKYTKFDLGNNFTIPDLQVGSRSKPGEYEVPGVEVPDECVDYGLEGFIPQDDIDQAASLRAMDQSIIDPQLLQTEVLTDVVILGRERRVSNIVFNPANYLPQLTEDLSANSGAQQFDNFASSDPIAVLTAFLDSCVVRPNMLVFGQVAWSAIRRHPRIMKAINRDAGDTGTASRQQVADIFEVAQIKVGSSWVNLTLNGTNPTLARTWGPHCAGLFVDPQAARTKGLTWGFTANYRGRYAGALPDQRMGARGGVWVRVIETVKEEVAAQEAGFLLTNVAGQIPAAEPEQN